jgi:heme/copper-type cytochrome/quinol oxidase subunit 3
VSDDVMAGDLDPQAASPAIGILHSDPEEVEFELRAAEGAMWTGGRLVIGIAAFAFASLAFAFFYLRSANSDNLFRPGGVTAPTHIGLAILILTLLSTLLNAYGVARLRRGMSIDWEVAGWTALASALVAVSLQIWEMSKVPFFPGSSGYASCFVGWAVMNCAILLMGAYWMETLLARSMRLRRAVAQDGGAGRSTQPVARLFRANLEGCTHFWWFISMVGLLFWLMFYVL